MIPPVSFTPDTLPPAAFVQFPMPRRIFVWRIQNRMFEEGLGHLRKSGRAVFYSATPTNKRMQTRADDYVSKEMSIHALAT